MAVVEGFRDLRLRQVAIFTGYSGADCGYPFEAGGTYVVYAFRARDGQLATTICSRTRPLPDAFEDVAYLRSLPRWHRHRPRASGESAVVARDARKPSSQRDARRLSHRDWYWAGVLDTRGFARTLRVHGSPARRVRRASGASPGYDSSPNIVIANDPRGCDDLVIYAVYDGRVTGRVVDVDTIGVRGVLVELVRPDELEKEWLNGRKVWTAANGTFGMG
jgi:hypothetical protein